MTDTPRSRNAAARQAYGKWDVLATSTRAGACGACVLSALDLLANPGALSVPVVAAGLGLALLDGALFGATWGALAVILGRLPFPASIGVVFALCAAFFVRLAIILGVFENLSGRYRALGVAMLVACVAGAILFTAVGVSLLPRGNSGASWLTSQSPRRRIAAAACLGTAALTLAIADRKLFPGSYSAAHWALRVCCIALGVAMVSTLQFRPRTGARVNVAVATATLLLGGMAFVVLHEPQSRHAGTLIAHPLSGIHLSAVRNLLDFDGDGFSSLLGGGDCAPFDRNVGPGARELPGNGIDDNCMLGDATRGRQSVDEVPLAVAPSPVDVVLITVDTLRPDRTSAYGYERATTPQLARFTEAATRFDAAYSTGGWTSLAVPSLHRGLYPRQLTWEALYETTSYRYVQAPFEGKLRSEEKVRARFLLPISDPQPTLAQLLSRRGMETVAVVDGGFTEVLAARWGMGKGFEQYIEVRKMPKRERNDAGTATAAIRALHEQRQERKPFFLWVHFFGPHAPSTKHDGIEVFGSSAADQYDDELLYLDSQLGRLLDELARGSPRPLATLIASDHGEMFYNARSRGHGANALNASMQIPLICRGPGFTPGRVETLASLADVMPTILALTETPGPDLPGLDLRTLQKPSKAISNRTIFFELFMPKREPYSEGFRTDLVAGLRGNYRLVSNRIANTQTLTLRDDSTIVTGGHTESALLAKAIEEYVESTGGVPRVLPEAQPSANTHD